MLFLEPLFFYRHFADFKSVLNKMCLCYHANGEVIIKKYLTQEIYINTNMHMKSCRDQKLLTKLKFVHRRTDKQPD